MLGGTFLSRLNMNLREDKHWSYGAFSGANLLKGPSYYSARTGVQTDKTKESIQEILKELTQINTDKPISKEEFENEQNSAVLSLPADWQTNSGVLSFLYSSVWYNRGTDYPGKYSSILKNITLPEVQEAARIIQPANLTWLIVGDLQKVEAGIRELNLGPVKVLNADGQVIR
jgi:zinc protease